MSKNRMNEIYSEMAHVPIGICDISAFGHYQNSIHREDDEFVQCRNWRPAAFNREQGRYIGVDKTIPDKVVAEAEKYWGEVAEFLENSPTVPISVAGRVVGEGEPRILCDIHKGPHSWRRGEGISVQCVNPRPFERGSVVLESADADSVIVRCFEHGLIRIKIPRGTREATFACSECLKPQQSKPQLKGIDTFDVWVDANGGRLILGDIDWPTENAGCPVGAVPLSQVESFISEMDAGYQSKIVAIESERDFALSELKRIIATTPDQWRNFFVLEKQKNESLRNALNLAEAENPTSEFIDIVFDGPPSRDAPRFVEVENSEGKSINAGSWVERQNGTWALRIPMPRVTPGYPKGMPVAEIHSWLKDQAEKTGNEK